MLSWLNNMTFYDGTIPMFNDSVAGIALSSNDINKYATKLRVIPDHLNLSESGFRKAEGFAFEMYMDLGEITPKYQPGHAHAGILSFILHVRDKPFLVDRGISTYETNSLRIDERGTSSHNTVTIKDKNQSQVWASFRVGKRARVINFEENHKEISATHDGYRTYNVRHSRKFCWKDQQIIIEDSICPGNKLNAIAHFHFHPDVKNIKRLNSTLIIEDYGVEISFEGAIIIIEQNTYQFASGFNKTFPAQKITIKFVEQLRTKISL